jgi:hypothetical protein
MPEITVFNRAQIAKWQQLREYYQQMSPGLALQDFNDGESEASDEKEANSTASTLAESSHAYIDIENGRSSRSLPITKSLQSPAIVRLDEKINAANQFLFTLENMPELLYLALYKRLQQAIDHFELTNPANQRLSERIFLYTLNKRLGHLHTTDVLFFDDIAAASVPAHLRVWQLKYASLCGLLWAMDEFDVFLPNGAAAVSRFTLDEVISTLHIASLGDLPDHLASGWNCHALYRSLAQGYLAASGSALAQDFAEIEECDYAAALSRLVDAEPNELRYPAKAEEVAQAIEKAVNDVKHPDFKFYTTLLTAMYDHLKKNPDPAAREKLEVMGKYASGAQSMIKIVSSVLSVAVAGACTVVSLSSFGVNPMKLEVGNSSYVKSFAMAGAALSGLLAIGLFRLGRQKGLSKSLSTAAALKTAISEEAGTVSHSGNMLTQRLLS